MSGDDLDRNYHYFRTAGPISNQPMFGFDERIVLWLDESDIPVLKEKILDIIVELDFGKGFGQRNSADL